MGKLNSLIGARIPIFVAYRSLPSLPSQYSGEERLKLQLFPLFLDFTRSSPLVLRVSIWDISILRRAMRAVCLEFLRFFEEILGIDMTICVYSLPTECHDGIVLA